MSEFTQLLVDAQSGDQSAIKELFEAVYSELQRLARVVRKGKAGDTMNTTALVHEAYLKLAPSQNLTFENRIHFFRVAARAMRQVLVSQARRNLAEKRGGGVENLRLDDHLEAALLERPEMLLALDEALERLEKLDERQAKIVECRFFAGMTVEETAVALDLSEPTVYRDWRVARAWLAMQLEQD